ncbi:MAG: hypothetical protein ACI8TP_001850 [Acidimicrobiales bacterium]|jgi:uncharacterized protein YdeI (YjbR/CyaY-like superfamily)
MKGFRALRFFKGALLKDSAAALADELQHRLDNDTVFRAAFESLSPG